MATEARITLSAEDRTARVLAGVRANLGQIGAEAATLARGFGLLGPAAVGALSLGAIAAFVRSTAKGLDALNDLKDATGASIENISALEDVAARTGTSFDAVGTSLVKFNSALKDAKAGSDVERVLKSIGLDAERLKAIDPAEALRQTAVALSRYADDGNKARIVQELFGRSVREVAPFLNDLASKGELVATVTTKQAEEAEKFTQQLDALSKNAQDLARTLTSALLPAINSVFARAKDQGGFFALLKNGLSIDIDQIKAQRTSDAIAEVTDELLRLQEASNNDKSLLKPGGAAVEAQIEALRTRLRGLQADAVSTGESLRKGLNANSPLPGDFSNEGRNRPKPSVKVTDKPITPKISELEKYIQRLQDATIGALDLSAVEQAELDIVTGKLGKLTKAQEEQVLALAKGLDLLKKQELTGPEIPLDLLRQRNDAQKELNSLLASTPTEQLRALLDAEENINEAFLEGRINADQLADALGELEQRYDALTQIDLEDVFTKADAAAEAFGATVGNAFEEAIIGGKGLSDVFKGLEQDILRITTRKLVSEPISNAVTGFLQGSGGGGAGGAFVDFFKNLFNGAGSSGGSSGQFGIGLNGFASGTDFVSRDQLAFIHRGERIVPAAENKRSGGGMPITINVNTGGAAVGRETLQQLQAAIGTATGRAMRRNT